MTLANAYRRSGKDLQPLVEGADGFECSEGDVIVVVTRSANLPRLFMQATDIPVVPGSQAKDGDVYVAHFERLIDTWAGRTTLTLSDGDIELPLRLDVRPADSKLKGGEWEALITELSALSDTLPWGMSPGTASGNSKPEALATVHPAIIEHQLPILCRLLRALATDPPTRILRVRTQRPLDASKAADLRTLRWLSRRPLELKGLRGLMTEGENADPRVLADQPAVIASIDHPVTRYVCYLLARVQARLAETAKRLRRPAGHGVPDPAERAYARQLATDVEDAARRLASSRRTPLFLAVRPEPLSDAVLQSLQDHPLQAAIHQVCRALLRPGLAYRPNQDLSSGLKHSYDLFELLVLYRLVGFLNDAFGAPWKCVRAATIDHLPHEDRPKDGASWEWRRPDGVSVEFRYQAIFRSARPPPDVNPYASLSARGVPDFVIVVRRQDVPLRWMILDAKYRASRKPINDGLADIHRYRDSLRLDGVPADSAYIVVPRLGPGAEIYGTQAYLTAHSMGALAVYGDDWTLPLRRWLASELPSLFPDGANAH